MSHIKFISVPNHIQSHELIDKIGSCLSWQAKEFLKIKQVFFEHSQNKRVHTRLTFDETKVITRLVARVKKTMDNNVFSLRCNDTTVLFEVMNNLKERFKIKSKGAAENNIINVKFKKNEGIYDLLCLINNEVDVKLAYISKNKSTAFIKAYNKNDALIVKKLLTSLNYDVRQSSTELVLEKFPCNSEVKSLSNFVVSKKKIVRKRELMKESDSDDSKTKVKSKKIINKKPIHKPLSDDGGTGELKKQLSELSDRLAKVVEKGERQGDSNHSFNIVPSVQMMPSAVPYQQPTFPFMMTPGNFPGYFPSYYRTHF